MCNSVRAYHVLPSVVIPMNKKGGFLIDRLRELFECIIPLFGLICFLGLIGFVFYAVICIDLSQPYLVAIEQEDNLSYAGSTINTVWNGYNITLNADEFECSNTTNVSDTYNYEKAKFILGHEALHIYHKTHIIILDYNNIQGNFYETRQLNKLQYVDESIQTGILDQYNDSYEKGAEKFIRTVNYCYYAQTHGMPSDAVYPCRNIPTDYEAIEFLNTFYQTPEVEDYVKNICENRNRRLEFNILS